ncbi:MAG: acyl-CoA thioesterase [Deltaproteobacteria bacterium]|jgi:acyl-CoA thioester hydrolase|nr:acyl-CoA thioesterase [Deltaproteobacteria bacterium]
MSQEIIASHQTFTATTWYRVLYVDTDAMGIVNNGHYFRYFEQGRGELLRQLKMPYSEIERRGFFTPLTEAWAHFYHSFRYDDLIRIECWISLIKKASFRFDYRLYLEDSPELMVSGHTVHATLNSEHKVVKIPDWLLEIIRPRSQS